MKSQEAFRGLFFIAVIALIALILIWSWNADILGLNVKKVDPGTRQNIRIKGESGAGFHNIRLEDNFSDRDGKYNVYRIIYDPKHAPFDAMEFKSLADILDYCDFLKRREVQQYTLIYTDWDVVEGLEDPTTVFVYFVTQDDGDFSNPITFG